MKINEYEIRDIVKRIYRLQLKFHRYCRKLGKIEVDHTPFGDYIGGLSFEDVLEEMDICLNVEDRDLIRWKLKYCDITYDCYAKPDIYNGYFDLKYMKEFGFKKVALEYLERRQQNLVGEIANHEFQIKECNEELTAIDKIRQKWKTT